MYADDILNLTFFPIGTILQFSGSQYSRLTSARTADNKVIWTLCDGTSVNEIAVPNLVDKFLRGSLASGAAGGADSQSIALTTNNLPAHSHEVTGLSLGSDGAHTHTLSGGTSEGGSHTHTLSDGSAASAGTHSHNYTSPLIGSLAGLDHDSNGSTVEYATYNGGTTSFDGSHTHTVSGTISTVGTHTHDFSSTSSATSAGAHSHTISGSIGSAGSGTAFSVETVPGYYSVVYIMKVA
jgi:hypothetical protein